LNNRILEHRPPRIALLLLVFGGTLHLITPLGDRPVLMSSSFAAALGLFGFGIMMWAWWQFKKRQLAICPTDHTEHLITDGIYRFSRNPMYLGMLTMLTGVATWFGTAPFFAAAAAFFLIIHLVFCPYEERKLLHTFGEDYSAYLVEVRRWF
jgi:protein-S-isoprenylcysteine O-methyltransferase Ste14